MAKTSAWPWPPELDALIAAPKHHILILENEKIRLMDTRIPVGETVPVHTHRWPGVYHTIRFSHFIRRDGEGKLLFDSRTVIGDRPGAAFLENLPPHSVENVGDCEIHLISVELKG
jgi:quercetin dioxygenase-like cupin family protein